MATPNVLAFKLDGRPIEFTVWLDDLQLFLLTDAKEGVSLFDYVSGTAVTPAADAPALERSQWQTCDAAARLAIRNQLPITERAHFSQHRTAQTLYNAIVACYSSPATAAIGRLMLPYLFPDLSSFTTAEDLDSHLRATCRHAASAPSGKRRSSRGGRGGRGGGGGGGAGGGGGGGGGGGRGGRGGGGGGGGGGGTGSGGGGSSGGGGGGSGSGIGGQGQHAEGDCYLCVPPDPGIAPAALGACESAPLGPAPAQALHTFTLDSGASRCFFRNSTTVNPLPAPVPVSLADPSWGPVLARSSTVLPCPAVPSGELSGLHLPSFSTNLVSNAVLQDAGVDTFTPGRQRVAICTFSQTHRHLATFARAPGSSLYTLTTVSRSAPLSPQLHVSAQVATQCECRRLSHDTLLWHHRLGHPSLPRLRSMHSRLQVSGLPKSLPPLPPSPAPPCIPCVEGRQRAAPHSSSFPPTETPLQALHLDVWGPALLRGQGHECETPTVVYKA
ncbi:unnamed protein product [Closterium sp. NIES-53]